MRTVYFDTSVFLSILMKDTSSNAVGDLLVELEREKVRILTSIITIQEVCVKPFEMGKKADDRLGLVSRLARVVTIDAEIAMLAAKFEARILAGMSKTDRAKSGDNPRRKWDCFHIATAVQHSCDRLYTLDERMLRRQTSFGLTAPLFAKPVARSPRLTFEAPLGQSDAPGSAKPS